MKMVQLGTVEDQNKLRSFRQEEDCPNPTEFCQSASRAEPKPEYILPPSPIPRDQIIFPADCITGYQVPSFSYRNLTTPPVDLNDLQQRITREFDALRRGQRMIRRSFDDMTRRANTCIRLGGRHVEGRDAR